MFVSGLFFILLPPSLDAHFDQMQLSWLCGPSGDEVSVTKASQKGLRLVGAYSTVSLETESRIRQINKSDWLFKGVGVVSYWGVYC